VEPCVVGLAHGSGGGPPAEGLASVWKERWDKKEDKEYDTWAH